MYNKVGFALTEHQIEKLSKGKRDGVATTLELSQNQKGGEHELYLTKRQISRLGKGKPVRITFSKTQMRAQKGGFLGAILGLAKTLLPKLLPVLGTLGISAASGAISGATHKATGGGGVRRAGGGSIPLIFGRNEIGNILDSINRFEGSGLIPKGSCKKCMDAIKKQDGGFIGTLLAGLAGSLLPALLGGKGLSRAGQKKLY